MPLSFHPEAEAEFDIAFHWYENQKEGLGTEFVLCVNQTIEFIMHYPELHPIAHNQIRKTLVRRFPFTVLYKNMESGIRVIAVYHSKRNPARWQTRK